MNNEEKVKRYAMVIQPLNREDGGGYEAYFPQLRRGVTGQGRCMLEAIGILRNALDLFLDVMKETGQDLPDPYLLDLFV